MELYTVRSGNFRLFKYSRISDFVTFHEVYNTRISIFFGSVIIIIIFARFLNLRNCPPREIPEKLKPREYYQIYSSENID